MRTEPLEFHRNDDLTAIAKGTPEASEAPRLVQSAPPPPPTRAAGASLGEGGRLTSHLLPPGTPGPILASLRRLEASGVGDPGPLGVPTGNGGQMGPLHFDPQGADFTAWIQRFVNEVYRNWIVPPSASLGWAGQVDYEFVVDRSGTMTSVTLVETSGTPAYDRAAKNALLGSRLLPLPADYAPSSCTMRVGFVYNTPRGGGRGGR
jgi:TonB family protein